MRPLFTLFAWCICVSLMAQSRPNPVKSANRPKPELTYEYFENIRFTLPADLVDTDSVRVGVEARRLARQLLKATDDALVKYRVPDTTMLAGLLDARVQTLSMLGRYGEAAQGVEQHRRVRPGPPYSPPYGLMTLAQAEAAKRVPQDVSLLNAVARFGPALQTAFRNQLNRLPAEHRSDLINAMKGAYAARMVTVNRENIRKLIGQAQKTGVMPFDNALELIYFQERLDLLSRYQKHLEAVLYELSPARVEEQIVRVPLRDGVKLNGILYRDVAATGRVPALVTLSPYPTGNEAIKGNVFATNGYVWLYVDTRGRRDSEGTFTPYEHDAQDLYDIIDWASKQPWCDGQVATTGGSYLGFVQWQAIRKAHKHPALKAINPMAAVGFGVDFPRESHIFYPYILQWATLVSGKELNDAVFNDYMFWLRKAYQVYKYRVPFARLDSVAGMPNPYFQRWVSHPDFDRYWQDILPSPEDYAAIDIPILTTTGYFDGDQGGAMFYYDNHQRYGSEAAKARHYLLIGPYDHAGAQWQPRATQGGIAIEKAAQIPLYKHVIQWFDWVLKGRAKPDFVKDRINYFAVGMGEWRGTTSFEAATQDTLRFYLSPTTVSNAKRKTLQSLSLTPEPTDRPIVYRHNIAAVLDSAWLFSYEKRFDDTRYLTSPHNLVFETPPLEKEILLTNKIVPRLRISLNVPDADFMVRLYEVTPDGKNYSLGYSAARTRYRNGGDKPQLMTPGQPADILFGSVYIYIRKLRRGSRLRMTFESINTPEYEKNYGYGGVVSQETPAGPRIIEATLHTGPGGSYVDVPYASLPLELVKK